VRLDHDDGTFVKMVQEHKGTEMRICVFNTHTLCSRETTLVPSDGWGGNGLLGITIRFDVVQPLEKHTLHVLDVYPNSPASTAGLDGYNDFVLGVGELLFDGPDEFAEIVRYNCNRPVRLYVYNTRSESVREVVITPNMHWGGDGCLGCGVGAGYLHSLPRRRDQGAAFQDVPPAAAAAPAAAPADAAADDPADAGASASTAAEAPPVPAVQAVQ
jgi:hypothetical protein